MAAVSVKRSITLVYQYILYNNNNNMKKKKKKKKKKKNDKTRILFL